MVRRNGAVVVLDFGLAVDLSYLRSRKAHGCGLGHGAISADECQDVETTGGTLSYMAPEQATSVQLTEAADWYAFGCTLYQALTGRRPFDEDPSTLLHRKLTEDGPPPSRICQEVPSDLDTLVSGLLRLNPQDRIEGGAVLAALGGSVLFPRRESLPGLRPFLGRDSELAALQDAFEQLDRGATVLVELSGSSGYGKSAVLERFLEMLSEVDNVLILRGQCYEQESMPYNAIDSVMDSLALYLARLSPGDQERLLPEGMGALARLFPGLRRVPLITMEAEDYEGPLSGGRKRAFEAMRELLQRIGERSRLVISIDDEQWADEDSALLLDTVIGSGGAPRAMVICSHRIEYALTSVFPQHLDAMITSKPPHLIAKRIELRPLSNEESRELALQLLAGQADAVAQAQAIAVAAGGSPYFIAELVRHIRDGILDTESRSPDLDSALRQRVERLPEASQQLLEVVAVAAGPIELRSAREACQISFEPLLALAELRNAHLLRTSGAGGRNLKIETYHDRVREAIVSGLTKETRCGHHGRLASVLETQGGAPAETIAFHCEQGGFTEKAFKWYGKAATESIQSLALDRALALLRRAAQFAPDLESRTGVLERLVHLQTDLARFDDAYQTGREATLANGFFLPRKFVPPLFLIDLLRFVWLRRNKTLDQLREYPAANDAKTESAVRLMAAVGKAAYQIRPELCISVMAKIVNLCLKRGMTKDCAIGFMAFGTIFLGGILGRHRAGQRLVSCRCTWWSDLATTPNAPKSDFVVGYFGTSWLRPCIEAEALWRVALESGKASGDLFHTGCAACAMVLSMFLRGEALDNIWLLSETHFEFLHTYGLKEPEGAICSVRQAIRNIRGLTTSPVSFTDLDFDERQFETQLNSYGSRHFALYYYVTKMQVLVLRGLYSEALIISARAEPFVRGSQGMLHLAELTFYKIFALLACGRKLSMSEEIRARRSWRQFRCWAGDCPANFKSRERLLAAEFAKRSGGDALAFYSAAAASAAEYGHPHLHALAESRPAVFLGEHGRAATRPLSRISAQSIYRKWGADALAQSLVESAKV